MREVDDDQSGTIDFFEFVNVYMMLSKGEGMAIIAVFVVHRLLFHICFKGINFNLYTSFQDS